MGDERGIVDTNGSPNSLSSNSFRILCCNVAYAFSAPYSLSYRASFDTEAFDVTFKTGDIVAVCNFLVCFSQQSVDAVG